MPIQILVSIYSALFAITFILGTTLTFIKGECIPNTSWYISIIDITQQQKVTNY